MKRRVLSILMVLVLCLGLYPTYAWAAEGDTVCVHEAWAYTPTDDSTHAKKCTACGYTTTEAHDGGGSSHKFEMVGPITRNFYECTLCGHRYDYYEVTVTLPQNLICGSTAGVTASCTIEPGSPIFSLWNLAPIVQGDLDLQPITGGVLPADMPAGMYYLLYVGLMSGTGQITGSLIFNVAPETLDIASVTATARNYEPDNQTVTVTKVTTTDGEEVALPAGTTGTLSGQDAGTYTSVTLPRIELEGGNRVLSAGTYTTSVTISRIPYNGETTAEAFGKFGVSKTFDFNSLLPAGAVLGTVSVTDGSKIFVDIPKATNGILSYTLVNDEKKVGESAVVTVPVTSSTNYEAFNLTITITVEDKSVPTLTVSPITVDYTGEPVPDSAIKGTAAVDGQTIPGTWSFAAGQGLTTVADSGAKTVKFTPDETHADDCAAVEGTVAVTINKATPKGDPTYTAISANGKTLADAGLAAPGGWPNGTLSWNLPPDTAVTSNTEYEWVFTPDDAANYNTLTSKIKLWPYTAPSNPGGSGSGGSSSGSSGTLTLPVSTTGQGSAAVTTTTTAAPAAGASGGTATAVVDTALGNEIVRQAVANHSETVVIAPKITGSVTRAEVSIPAAAVRQLGSRTGASLTVSTPVAEVSIPNGGLGGLAAGGGTIAVAAEKTGNTVELSVTAGGKTVERVSGGLTLTVPVENAAPGTVAVLVREDGTREVVRKSVAGSGSMTVPLAGSARLEIVDNSKRFIDVPGDSWAADAVAFASARGLFNGTGPDRFGPSLLMSRGMLAVVLHRLENDPVQAVTDVFGDVDSRDWYAESIAWAAAQGIISGYGDGRFGPNNSITREQLAVMLWRYAGCPVPVGKELPFADADQVSGYALEALCWAVENGVLSGYAGGHLNPGGTATRAQTAQMLMNYLKGQ